MSKGVVVATPTGDTWTCPICGGKYRLVHKHRETADGRITKLLKHDFVESADSPSTFEKRKILEKKGMIFTSRTIL